MNDSRIVSLTQLREFLKGSIAFEFQSKSRKEKYAWINEQLNRFRYLRLKRKKERAVVKQYIRKVTGISKAQLKRLIRKKKDTGRIFVNANYGRKNTFQVKYGPRDIQLLIQVDNAHNRLNGPATKHILKREAAVYGRREFSNLKEISISRMYDLRATRQYLSHTTTFTCTQAVQRNIGLRKKPTPNGKPGYLRVDSVHQGDRNGEKGVYYVNFVDEVLQWELVVCVEGISEQFLTPALKTILICFPFVIRGFHSDNGSEFINRMVADILNGMCVEQTKSRSRRTNDNALVESKNGSVVRKWFGRNHIAKTYAPRINQFCEKYLNVYLNFHRPCGFVTVITDKLGKKKKIYKPENYMTPYEKLKSLKNPKQYLAPGRTMNELDDISITYSDTEFAECMQTARVALFRTFKQ